MFIIECFFFQFQNNYENENEKIYQNRWKKKSLTSSFEGSLIQNRRSLYVYASVVSRSLPMATKYFLD